MPGEASGWNSEMEKYRIDLLLVEAGLADSRSKAQALVMAGDVVVDDKRVEKPSEKFKSSARIRIRPNGYICLDIGSSTGGFTDCLLSHGAKHVVAVDAGTNQLAWKLRDDPRVEVREKTNARYLKPEDFSVKFDLVVVDVSFISATKVVGIVPEILSSGGRLIVLVKPQFEVGRADVGKGGIVRDEAKRSEAVQFVSHHMAKLGLRQKAKIESPVKGAKGNVEYLVLYEPEEA